MANGEKVPPVDMELAIQLDPLLEQALVVGEGKPYLGALVALDMDEWFQRRGGERARRRPRRREAASRRRSSCSRASRSRCTPFPATRRCAGWRSSRSTGPSTTACSRRRSSRSATQILERYRDRLADIYRGHGRGIGRPRPGRLV